MQEQEVRFKSGEIELAGTVALPDGEGPFPCVLLITGSGQVDRNENVKRMPINAFYDISHFLAQNGVASLRYDKRGVGQSQGDHWKTGLYDHADDALAAVRYLKQQNNVQRQNVFLLGHSEGAVIATRLAGTGAEVAGIVLIAGTAQSGEAVLRWQAIQIARGLKGLNARLIKLLRIDVSKSQQKAINKIKQSNRDWYRQNLFVKVNAKWLREFMAYNPADDMPRIAVPVLAITGSKDIQVDPADLERMANVLKVPFERYIIKGMTHVLRTEEGEPSISEYKKEVRRPVETELLDIILRWLKNQTAGRSQVQS
jgi:alpha-beta hydrolase superfamily lysophospholipase